MWYLVVAGEHLASDSVTSTFLGYIRNVHSSLTRLDNYFPLLRDEETEAQRH